MSCGKLFLAIDDVLFLKIANVPIVIVRPLVIKISIVMNVCVVKNVTFRQNTKIWNCFQMLFSGQFGVYIGFLTNASTIFVIVTIWNIFRGFDLHIAAVSFVN